MSILVLAAAASMTGVGCDSTNRTTDGSVSTGSGVMVDSDSGASVSINAGGEANSDGGLFGWIDAINPFKSETRAAVESYRVSYTTRPDGWRQASVDIDLSRGDGPRSLLAAVTRSQRSDPADDATEQFDLISLIVRDDPRQMMLFDDAPAFLVVARERIELAALPSSPDSVKRAGSELQASRSFRVPDGVLDRLTAGAPVQLLVMIGGREVARTIPGAACEAIEAAGAGVTSAPAQ